MTGPPYVKFYAGYPLKSSSGHRLDTLCIIDAARRRFSAADRDMLLDLGQLAQDQLRSVSLAHMDVLTHISNRRGFEVLARQALGASTRAGAPATLLLFDVNGFKRINDELGHDAGDATLVELARCLLKTCMPGRTETLDESTARADGLMYTDKARRRQSDGPRAVRG